MGLSDQLRGIVPARVTYAQAEKVWEFGVECEEAAVKGGDGYVWDDPGQTTRVNNLDKLRAWSASFGPFSPGDVEMDPGNWDALRTQVYGAAADLESLGEVDDAFYRRLDLLGSDLALAAAQVPGQIAAAAGDLVGKVGSELVKGAGATGIILIIGVGVLAYFIVKA